MSKKLLSILVAVVLALGIFFMAGQPATEAKAATAVNHSQNLFPAGTTGTQTANCPVCGSSQTWYDFNQLTGTIGGSAGAHETHYYLSEDFTADGSKWYGNLITFGSNFCLHLNGNQLTTGSRLHTASYTVNVIAGNNGRVIYTGSKSMVSFFNYGGTLNIYGGTYTESIVDGSTSAALGKLSGGNLNLYDATINGTLLGGGTVTAKTTLYGSTTVDTIDFSAAAGSVVLADGWRGSITEYVPKAGDGINATTGAISSNHMTVLGTISGTIGNLAWNGTTFACVVAITTVAAGGPPANATVDAFYPTVAAAVAAYGADAYANNKIIKLSADAELPLVSGIEYYVNANGNDVTVKGAGTLHPIDTLNDVTYALTYGHWDLDEFTGTLDNDVTCGSNRYLTIKEGNVYTTHRLEMKLTHVTLRTFNAGLYFKAEYKCDDTLAARVTRYGVAVSKDGIPQAVGGTGVGYSELTTGFEPDVSHSVNTNSGAVVGIFNTGAEADNKARAETPIGARVYFTVDIDGANTLDCLSSEGGSYSLYDVLRAIDTGWGNYNETQRTTVHNFYNAWEGIGAANCRIENFGFNKLSDANELEYELKVGYAYFDMTPTGDVTSLILGGRGSTTTATGIKEKLPGTCIAFTDENGQTVLMYTLDLLYVSDEIVKFAADIATETGVPESNILINGTHSHSAPHPVSALYPENAAYITGLKAKMIAAGETAIADQRAAKMYTASVKAPNMNSVRHYLMSGGTYAGDNFGDHSLDIVQHAEAADNEIQLIKFVRDGSDILLMNWQGHPNRPGQTDEYHKAILSGLELMRQELLKEENGNMQLAFFLGASGNVNNSSRIDGEIPTQNDYEKHYAALLQKALTASFKEVSAGKLQVLTKTVSLLARDNGSLINQTIYGFSVGDVAFAIAPYEMFNSSGLFIKKYSPYETTFISTCSMGTSNYIPTDEVYNFTVNGNTGAGEYHVVYEANGCPFVRGSAEILAEEFVTLLRQLKAG
ncbi:MAG: hypothetical protein IKC95_04305 [Oscillospiraceae bacterium]|nr:hypothetical protein [Oscillospiraceae bacterium]